MNASILVLAWRQTLRDLRAGELRLLAVAVMLAVAALTAVAFLADRINGGLARDARALLGGDAVIASDQPAPPELAAQAKALGLRTATTVNFPSMARATDAQGGAVRLVAVKAVSDGYPLRGALQVRRSAEAAAGAPAAPASGAAARAGSESVTHGPPRGTVWVDAPVLDALGLRVGDALLLGESQLVIDRVIVNEPDRGGGFISFAPRLMLHADDLHATALVQPASRVTWRLAVAAPGASDAAVTRFTAWTRARIDAVPWRGVRVESLEAGRPETRQTLDRAEKFLNLVALLAALLAAVAVGIAARDFAQRHLDACAMLRVLGLPQRRIAGIYALEFAFVGLLASALGVLAGLAVHFAFVQMLAGLVKATLPPPGWWPALFGLGVGLTLLAGFGLPPVLQLARVPPLRVIRRDVGQLEASSLLVLAMGAGGFIALLMAISADPKLGGIAVGGFAFALGCFALLAWLAVRLLRRVVPGLRAPRGWPFGATFPRWLVLATRQLAARPAFAVLQVSALAVGLMALVLLVLLRTDLIGAWRAATPPDAPDRFVINLQPDQHDGFARFLDEWGVARRDLYPMIRGRLVAVNGRAVTPADYADDRAQRLVEREFNLSHAAAMPSHNTLAGGAWRADEADAVSVEEGLAKTLGLKLGDRMRFDIAGQMQEGRITSLRKVDWASMRVNFFVMFPRAAMPELPATQISAFRASTRTGFDRALAQAFPNVTAVDVSATVAQVQGVLDQVIRAVEALFGFTLVAGLVVLFATVSATREQRAREYAVMRALGAGGDLLARVQRAELLGVGALAGLLASLAAIAIGWALARYAFEFAWQPPVWVPLAGAAAGALLSWAAGWWSLRGVLRRPVLQTLREA